MTVYDLAYSIGLGVSSPIWLLVPRLRHKVLEALRERNGAAPNAPRGRPGILIHAVSMGEINATTALVQLLSQAMPELRFIITTTSLTGAARARELYEKNPNVTRVRFPLDFSKSIRRLLAAQRPKVAVLMELEVWPNFMAECQRRGIPVVLVNGRLSAYSFRGYKLGGALTRPMFRRLTLACVQEEAYADRFARVGVAAERIRVTGTMKFDTAQGVERIEGTEALAQSVGLRLLSEPLGVEQLSPSPGTPGEGRGEDLSSRAAEEPSPQRSPGVPGESADSARPEGVAVVRPDLNVGRALPASAAFGGQCPPYGSADGGVRTARAKIWVCGSTGPGEEQMVLNVYADLRKKFPGLRLVIVPRHPQRFDEVAALVRAQGFTVIRRSQPGALPSHSTPQAPENLPVILGDTMGELRKFYSLADIVFVGRTLVDLGSKQHGSDMIEPAALARPVIVGPFTGNFAEVMNRFREADAMREVSTAEELRNAVEELLLAPIAATEMGQRARDVVLKNLGATAKHVAVILEQLGAKVLSEGGGKC